MGRWIGISLSALALAGCTQFRGYTPSGGDLPAIALFAPWSPPLAGHAARQSSWDRTGANTDSYQIAPGETVALLETEGAGVVRHIWITTNAPEPAGRTAVLRMHWDGAESPAVEMPLGDFFGVGHGLEADVNSFPVTVNADGRARNCWWPMPFSDGARITVTNDGADPITAFYCYVDYLALDAPPPTRERFHAQYRQAHPADSPDNHLILETEGAGHFVGTVYSVESTEPNWWGEGDDLIEVDGHEPLRGTGTEDYFNDAWGTRVYHQPWHGTSLCEGFSDPGMRTSAYRWHILDPIPYRERIRVSIEHGTENDRADNLSTVAFWYQAPPASPFPPMPSAIARLTGEARASHIRGQAFQLAVSGDSGAADEIEALAPHADDLHGLLITGMAVYAQAKDNPSAAALAALDATLTEVAEIIAATPEEELTIAPDIDFPTDSDVLQPSPVVEIETLLRRARHDLARRWARARGHLEPGDEVLVEVRGPDAQLTAAPTFESTEDWSYSYAKVEDGHLLGMGAHFTYGGAEISWARFTPDFPQSGRYEVLVTFSYGGNAGDTRWEIRHADGVDEVPLPQRGRPGTPGRNSEQWHSLGTFPFDAGQSTESGSATLHASPGLDRANDQFEYRAYADAVRFIYVGN